jgi:ring-1,2-phenylacetyl-CoA epoxidase subunit PaaD
MVNAHVNTKNIAELIGAIPDPEIPVISIKELGILRKVEYKDAQYQVTITPTYTACPAMNFIEDQIKEKLAVFGIDNVKVFLTYAPAWTSDWMSNETKSKLKTYGIAPPIHSSCNKTYSGEQHIVCPRCNSVQTHLLSRFGSTACKALYKCNACKEPFEYFKCH